MPVRVRYEKELNNVLDNLVVMCRHIEISIEKCIKALMEQDFELAREVHEVEKLMDVMEREIEHECLRILLMEQPVADDFNAVAAALKMITDLERISDQARDIADITIRLGKLEYVERPEHIPKMAVIVIQMVKDSVQAYINHDLALARSLNKTDDKADELFRVIMSNLAVFIKNRPDYAEQAIMFMMITKYLERIGDHAVNIGEWAEYAMTGSHPRKKS